MNSHSSRLFNVKVSILTTYYDESKRIAVPEEVTLIDNLAGHLQDLINSPETDIIGGTNRDRIGRYRLVFMSNPIYEHLLSNGLIVRVTHKKHMRTNAWIPFTGDEQYIVRDMSDIDFKGNWKSFNMNDRRENGVI